MNTENTRQLIPLALEDVVATPRFGGVWESIQLSHDGRWIAYTIQDERRKTSVDTACETGHLGTANSNVWITDVKRGASFSLTNDNGGSDWGPSWSPDDGLLAFYRTQGNGTHIWIWDRDTGKQRQVSEADTPHSYVVPGDLLRWSPGGTQILAKFLPKAESRNQETVEQSTVTVWTQESEGTVRRPNLTILDITDGKMHRLIEGGEIPWYAFSPDGSHMAYVVLRTQTEIVGTRIAVVGADLVVASCSGTDQRVVADNLPPGIRQAISWSPDGTTLSYLVKGNCFLTSIEDGQPRPVAQAPHPNFRSDIPPIWAADGKTLYLPTSDALWQVSVTDGSCSPMMGLPDTGAVFFGDKVHVLSSDGGRSLAFLTLGDRQIAFYRVDLVTGEVVKVPEAGGLPANISDLHLSTDGQTAVFLGQDSQHCKDLWCAETMSSRGRQLTRINPQFDRYVMGTVRVIEWETQDGQTLHGALMLPTDYQEGRRYPLVVVVYGGNYSSNKANDFGLLGEGVDNMQLLATRGYAVLSPDTPLKLGTPMTDVAETVISGVDKAVEIGVADPQRLGVMGHSYGGYSTLAVIVQTTRFKAAICRSGISNLVSEYGTMDDTGYARSVFSAERGQLRMGGAPWQFTERYVQNSPIFLLDKVETPLLVTHGSVDNSAFPTQSEEVFVGLRRLGKEVTYAAYAGENHAETLWNYPNQLDYCRRMIAWFNDHLKVSMDQPTVTVTSPSVED